MKKFFQNVVKGAEGTTLKKKKKAIPTISFVFRKETLFDSFQLITVELLFKRKLFNLFNVKLIA